MARWPSDAAAVRAAGPRPLATAPSPGCSSRRRSLLLLAINIFPLFWTIYLSFTNYRANRPNAPVKNRRHSTTTSDILTDPDVWAAMQATAHFVFWTIVLETLIGFGARLSDRPQVPRPRLLDDRHPDADDAVAGGGRQFLDASSTSRRSACSTTSSPSSPASRRPPSRCSATSRWRPGRSSSSISGCGRPT